MGKPDEKSQVLFQCLATGENAALTSDELVQVGARREDMFDDLERKRERSQVQL